eukprot:7426644-Pyramimonas_sp.AAC.1
MVQRRSQNSARTLGATCGARHPARAHHTINAVSFGAGFFGPAAVGALSGPSLKLVGAILCHLAARLGYSVTPRQALIQKSAGKSY